MEASWWATLEMEMGMTPRVFVAVGLTGLLACGTGETTTEPESSVADVQALATQVTTSLLPKVDGIVQNDLTAMDNSIVQALNVPSMEDRGIIEFDMRRITRPVIKATLILRVYASKGPYPFRIDVYGYHGNGSLDVDDWGLGTLVKSFQYAGDSLVKFDVTAKVHALRKAGENYAGFVFRFPVPSDIQYNGPFIAFRSLEYGPGARLRIVTE